MTRRQRQQGPIHGSARHNRSHLWFSQENAWEYPLKQKIQATEQGCGDPDYLLQYRRCLEITRKDWIQVTCYNSCLTVLAASVIHVTEHAHYSVNHIKFCSSSHIVMICYTRKLPQPQESRQCQYRHAANDAWSGIYLWDTVVCSTTLHIL